MVSLVNLWKDSATKKRTTKKRQMAMIGSGGVMERSSCYCAVVGGKNGRDQRVSFVDGKPREPHFTHGPEVIRLPRYGSWNVYAYIAEHQEPRPFYVGER